MDKDKKKIIALAIIFVVFIAIWLFVGDKKMAEFVFDNANGVLPYNDQNNINMIAEETYTMTEEERIYSYITEIFELFNNKEYQKLYSLLKDDFKKDQFPTYNSFEQFVSYYWDSDNFTPKFKKFSYKDEVFIVLTEILKETYTKEDLINGVSQRFETFVISEISENNYKFSFNEFISSRELESESQTVGPLTVELVKLNKYIDDRELYFKVTNNSDNEIGFSATKLYIDASVTDPRLYYKYYLLEPNQTDTLSLKYIMDYDDFSIEKNLILKNLTINDETIEMKLPIKYKE